MRKESVLAKFEEPVWLEELKNTKYVGLGRFSSWDLNRGHFGYKAGVVDFRLRSLVNFCKLTSYTGYYIRVDFRWFWIVSDGFQFKDHCPVMVTNLLIKYEDRMTELLKNYKKVR